MKLLNALAIPMLTMALAACAKNEPPVVTSPGPAVTIMTFNVENLFDTRDDPGKDDRTYLPIEMKQTEEHRAACARIENERWRDQCLNWDWSEAIVERKLEAVADAILEVGNGRGPDIVALQEVENLRILERLSRDYLAAADYRPILIEGDDERGIDVAFLTRLPVAEAPALHRIAFENVADEREADSRGILEATFRLPDGSLLTGYSVHFPAPFHPTGMRVDAYEALNRLAAALPADRAAFAAGDFNTTFAENRDQDMLERYARPAWTVVHEAGCEGCRGTSYYPPTDEWSFLDMILWRRADTTWRLRTDSASVANATAAQVTTRGRPARFALPEGTGVSDHWPLVAVIEPK